MTAPTPSSARARRDLATRGYAELVADLEERGLVALDELHARAARLVQPRVAQWRMLWERTVAAETARTGAQLARLAEADPGAMGEASVWRTEPTAGARGYGMCGRLQTWQWPKPDAAPEPPVVTPG